MDEDVIEEEEGANLLLASTVELAKVARFEKTTTRGKEGSIEVREGALEVEDLEVRGVGVDLGIEVGSDCETRRSAFRPQKQIIQKAHPSPPSATPSSDP